MRTRLFLRRLTVSAPRMAVRSALPWPLRWVVLAIALGFCAALALWAFEFGRDIAGLESSSRERLAQSRAELAALRAELGVAIEARDKAQSIANTSGTLLTSEKVAQERLLAQNKQLEAENRVLRDDLGFFEKLIPSGGGGSITGRGQGRRNSGDGGCGRAGNDDDNCSNCECGWWCYDCTVFNLVERCQCSKLKPLNKKT